MSKRTVSSFQMTEADARKFDALEQAGFGSRTDIIRTALDRMYKQEIAMSFQPFTDTEIESFQDVVLKTPGCPGAESFRLQNHYEVHVRSDDPSVDFPQLVQDWLTEHGFQRVVDPQRGPFYYR